jgi:hypothetical protein
MAALGRTHASLRQNRPVPVLAILMLLFKGYLTFAFFFFVRSEKLAFFDGTYWWDHVHHPYFRVCVAFIAAVCANNLADWLTFVLFANKTAVVVQFGISAIMWWAFTELCLINRQISHDHYYLWAGTGAWGVLSFVIAILKIVTLRRQTGFIDDSDYGLLTTL